MLKSTIEKYLNAACATKTSEDFTLSMLENISGGAVIATMKFLMPKRVTKARMLFAVASLIIGNAFKSATAIDKLEQKLAEFEQEREELAKKAKASQERHQTACRIKKSNWRCACNRCSYQK